MGWWSEVIDKILDRPFCRGEGPTGWRVDPDWLLKPGNAMSIMEGKFQPGSGPKGDIRRGPVRIEDIDQSQFDTIGELKFS
jgi:hypothetical protein